MGPQQLPALQMRTGLQVRTLLKFFSLIFPHAKIVGSLTTLVLTVDRSADRLPHPASPFDIRISRLPTRTPLGPDDLRPKIEPLAGEVIDVLKPSMLLLTRVAPRACEELLVAKFVPAGYPRRNTLKRGRNSFRLLLIFIELDASANNGKHFGPILYR